MLLKERNKKREMVRKLFIFGVFGLLLVLTVSSFASAGLFDWIKKTITGEATKPVDINITVGAGGGSAPTVISIFNSSAIGMALNEGPSNSNFTINFSVIDVDGVSNLNSATATINLTKTGETTRYNWTCDPYESSGTSANYTCQVMMWWWDGSGTWTVNATIMDNNNNKATNDTKTFEVSETTGFVQSPGNLTFATITAGSSNNTASNDPLLLNNTGNKDIAQTAISVNATNLVGEATSSQALYSGNFSVGNTTGSSAECSPISTLMNYTVSGGSYVNITLAVMNASNYSINNGQEGQEQLYFCLRFAGSELTQQSYSTRSQGSWTIQILTVLGLIRKNLYLQDRLESWK